MESDDVFSDHMDISRPPFCLIFLTVSEIVKKRVIPDIRDLLWIEWERDPEFIGFTRNRKIFEPSPHKLYDLIILTPRLDKIRMFLIELKKPLLIFRETEKIVLFGEMGNFFIRMVRTSTIHEIRFFFESFTSYTVEPIIHSLIDIPIFIRFLEYVLYKLMMTSFCCTNKICISHPTLIPEVLMLCCH